MPTTIKRRRRLSRGGALCFAAIAVCLQTAAPAPAAGPPVIGEAWASAIFSSTARLSAQVNPNGIFSTYHFDYITQAAYNANLTAAKEPFTGSSRIPLSEANIGSGSVPVNITQQISGLPSDTAYRWRLVSKNSDGTATSPTALPFATQPTGGAAVLADGRGWELVSPADKNGGEVAPPGAIAGGGALQAAAGGGAITYGSAASFAGGRGAPSASQYISTRAGGWSTQNITAPIFSGTYDATDQGVPYRLFSPDLARGLLLNGDHCRGEGDGCAVANPPLGAGAPAGYQNYYLRESSTASYTALLGAANAGFLAFGPAAFDLSLAGSSTDLRHAVLSTCAALTPDAVEASLGEGCDPAKANLYEHSPGAGLALVNLLPAQSTGTSGAALAAQAGAVSEDGSRVYWNDLATGDLYLRAAGLSKQVDVAAGGGGSFETASADGSLAFFSKAGHLYRYSAASDTAADLTPSGGVAGVLGASPDGAYVYYQDATALRLWHAGTTTTVATGAKAAQESNWPPATGTARVSADGTHLLFQSEARLGEYDNTDLNTGQADAEAWLYDGAGAGTLSCVSCNPTFGRPIGPAAIPAARANGVAFASYKPRALSANGRRVFFDSNDALVLTDTDNATDAYQWEVQGEGSCARAGGCISLISGGRTATGATFIDASADGADAFFLTGASLVGNDPGALDLYDARIGGGFPEAAAPTACNGDACQPLPSSPVDPTLTTLLAGPGNPAVRFPAHCKRGTVKRGGKCVKKAKGQSKKRPAKTQKKGGGR